MHKTLFTLTFALLLVATLASADAAEPGHTEAWQVALHARELGPVRFELDVSVLDDRIYGATKSGLFAFDAVRQADGMYLGNVSALNSGGEIQLQIADGEITGKVNAPPLVGEFQATPATSGVEARDYSRLLVQLDKAVTTNIYDPAALDTPAYRAFRKELEQVVTDAADDLDVLLGFRSAWGNDAFSHFSLRRSDRTAAEMIAYFDTMRVGFESATLEMSEDIATLKVRTMMGVDTIEQIQAAFAQIALVSPSTLIVDLRGNQGGAFAVKPLVEHIIDEPLTAGFFVSQTWNRSNEALPNAADVHAADPWQGWSIIDFYRAIEDSELIHIQFNPVEPNFDGQVYVLLDDKVASAAEMAADALSASGLATVVGEPSAGEMLSQKMFDLGDGFIVSLPVADYYSVTNGRIEGAGVAVDVPVDPAEALDTAKRMAL